MYLIETSEGENRGEAMFEIIAKNFSGQRKLTSKSIVFFKIWSKYKEIHSDTP